VQDERAAAPRDGVGPVGGMVELVTAISMTVGRGALARVVAETAGLTRADRVVDVGCGPGTAVRQASRLGAAATGIDPSALMLRFAHWICRIERARNVTWIEGTAEHLPIPRGQATVLWAISSLHHWTDRTAGLSECLRVLAPGGRLLLAERLTRPDARGHQSHRLTRAGAEDLARHLAAIGFSEVELQTRRAGHRRLVIIRAMAAADIVMRKPVPVPPVPATGPT